ncbi:MAG: hypothetical protein J6S67_22655 [Methanobrevibacter sp.]|nr:hypothetical protein [Methanobrevibacter sp.]
MTSTITLYYGTLLKQARNFLLDVNQNKGIETYLQSIPSSRKSVVNNFQYIKQALNITIKLDITQTGLNMGTGSQDLNYVKIQNGDENPCYYFVSSKTWRSQNTIELELAMDTLNTYRFNNDYNLSEKTLVKREHKNRFTEESRYLEFYYVNKIIDLKSEEISAPLYRDETNDHVLNDGLGEIGLSWSLYYKNATSQDDSPIDCYLVPESPINISYQSGLGQILASDITESNYIMFFVDYNDPPITIEVDGVPYTPEKFMPPIFVESYTAIAIKNNGGVLEVYSCKYTDGYPAEVSLIKSNPTYVKILNAPNSVKCFEITYLPPRDYVFGAHLYEPQIATKTLNFGVQTTGVLNGITSIDKTLSTNVKIINLPYSPTEVTLQSAVYTLDSCWQYEYENRRAKLKDFSKRFTNDIITDADDLYSLIWTRTNSWSGKRDGLAKRFIQDPKLLHSDFYRPKFVYDSFTKVFPLEQFSIDPLIVNPRGRRTFRFKFVMSRNIVSKFLFQFDYVWKNSTEDYPNIVAVSRNNEEVLYNSQYLDYIRTGYNYDLKAKARQEVGSFAGIGLSAVGLVASTIVGAVTGNPIAFGGAIASGVGLASQIVGYAKTTAQAEENIQRKLAETQRQSVSVMNADDYDLLYAYSLNKAKLCYYSVSSQMQNILDDLFYYCGYICNEQKVPDVYSRYWFNFVQAELEVSSTNNLTGEILDDIKEKFNNGVTFLHYHHNRYDFKQEMENFEIYLIQ